MTRMLSMPTDERRPLTLMLSVAQRDPLPAARPAPKPRVMGPKLPFETVPEYVATGDVICDLCDKKGVRFGFHAEPNTDLCMDCFHRFCNDKGPEIDAFADKRGVRPGQTKFVEFQPLR
jgi:hypothetical protein